MKTAAPSLFRVYIDTRHFSRPFRVTVGMFILLHERPEFQVAREIAELLHSMRSVCTATRCTEPEPPM